MSDEKAIKEDKTRYGAERERQASRSQSRNRRYFRVYGGPIEIGVSPNSSIAGPRSQTTTTDPENRPIILRYVQYTVGYFSKTRTTKG